MVSVSGLSTSTSSKHGLRLHAVRNACPTNRAEKQLSLRKCDINHHHRSSQRVGSRKYTRTFSVLEVSTEGYNVAEPAPGDIFPHPFNDGNPQRAPTHSAEDPWTDPKWKNRQWTVYRGQAYDLEPYMEKHPGGSWLINLALQRDCTGLFESYHLRADIASKVVARLPKIEDFPIHVVPRAPYPNDSELYHTIRERCRKELFDGGAKGEHRTGSEYAAAAVLGFAAICYAAYFTVPNMLTAALLGVSGGWIGLTIQHCGNHGAMSTKPWVNGLLGLTMDLIGGSSLMWRYHHQVSHHIHCNDTDMDEDVYSSFPMLRFDSRLPKYWYHNFQHLYMWLLFPLMQLAFEIGDMKAVAEKRTAGASLRGATMFEYFTVFAGKATHWGLLLAPLAFGASVATVACCAASYICTQGILLASLFAVSHNLEETKNAAWLETSQLRDDWAVQQILTSANWGHKIGCFFTGGLNLQIEHHLFPAVSFMHYPAISKIVKEEATKRGIPYAEYKYLPQILMKFQNYMKETGRAPPPPDNAFPPRGGIGLYPGTVVA